MKRITYGTWCWLLCGAVCLLAIGMLLGRMSAGGVVRIQTERPTVHSEPDSRTDTVTGTPEQASPEEPENPAFPVNLNTATEDELTQLPRIGPTLAERIIAYREEVGRIITPEQLLEIDGIGEKTLEAIRGLVTVEDSNENSGG